MTANGRGPRVARLEGQYRSLCLQCRGFPIRLVIEDLTTGHTEENYPRSGCPECGAPIGQLVEIIGEPGDDEDVMQANG